MAKEFKVVLTRDRDNNWMNFEFPDEPDRAVACFKLAKFASGEWVGYPGHETDTGYLRDLFFGTTMWHLYEIRTYASRPMTFVFREKETNRDKLLVTLKTQTQEERIEIIIKEDEE
ncbi:hypothetical protein IKG20_00665 [Candidatus Saccharibacteria bacterium]|nr:hypothetical protein [Candidatus Saccharibacteria bacterium]